MNDLFSSSPGTTPLDADDVRGLRPTWVTTRGELNALEEANIGRATVWATTQAWTPGRLLRTSTLIVLHKRMLDDVWTWAGQIRRRHTNVGSESHLIRTHLEDLYADVLAQIAPHPGSMTPDEIAARFHHRLVSIHPFPNGTGRHARLVTNLLLLATGQQQFTWGATLASAGDARDAYLSALRAADHHDYGPLLRFVRT